MHLFNVVINVCLFHQFATNIDLKLDRTMDMFLAWFKTYRLCGLTKLGSQLQNVKEKKMGSAHFNKKISYIITTSFATFHVKRNKMTTIIMVLLFPRLNR